MKAIKAIIILCAATLPIAESAHVRTIHADSRSILAEESTPPIQIALDQTGNKRVVVNVEEDASRPMNDVDIADEPGTSDIQGTVPESTAVLLLSCHPAGREI